MPRKWFWFPLAVLAGYLSGCNTMTNLTPANLERNPAGLYRFEMAWKSSKNSVLPETIVPAVLIGENSYEMQPTRVVVNRWETMVPIAAHQDRLHYRYKVSYLYNSLQQFEPDSVLSAPYQLRIRNP